MAVIAEFVRKEPAPLAPSSDSTTLVSDNGEIAASFTNSAAGNAIEIQSQGYFFRYFPEEAKYIDKETGFEDVICDADSSASAFVMADYQAWYDRHFLAIDERWTVEAGQLKHHINLRYAQRPAMDWMNPWFAINGTVEYSPDLLWRSNGLIMIDSFETSDAIEIVDSNGNLVFSIPAIECWDQERGEIGGLYIVSMESPGRLELATAVDNAWLVDPDRAYPVVIDPTVIATPQNTKLSAPNAVVGRVGNTNTIYAMALDNLVTGSVYTYSLYKSTDSGNTWTKVAALPNAHGSTYGTSGGSMVVLATGEVYMIAFDASSAWGSLYYYSGTGSTVTSYSPSSWTGGAVMSTTGCSDSNGNIWFVSGLTSASGSQNVFFIPKGNLSGLVRMNVTNATTIVYYPASAYWDTATASVIVGYIMENVSSTPHAYTAGIGKFTPNSATAPTSATFTSLVSFGTMYNSAVTKLPNGNVLWAYSATGSPTAITVAEYTAGGVLVNTKTVPAVPYALSGNTDNAALSVMSDGTNWYVLANCGATNGLWYTMNGGAWSQIATASYSVSAAQMNDYATATKNVWDVVYFPTNTSPYSQDYASVAFNSPPLAPSNLLPTGGSTVSSITPVLSGTFSDPDSGNTMSAVQVQVYRSSDNVLMWDSTKSPMTTTTTNQNWTIAVPASANLQYGVQYYWKATTWDNSSAQGAWSTNQVFLTEQAPTVTITSPTAAQVVTTSSMTAQLSYSQAANAPEASYQFQLLDINNNVLQDSGVVTGNVNNMWTFNGLQNNTAYQIIGYATTKSGTMGTSSKVSFSTSFTTPYAPTVTAVGNTATASSTINWINPLFKTGATAPTRTGTGTGNGTMSQPTTTDGTTASHSWRVVCTNATVPASFNVLVDGSSVGTARAGTAFSYNGVTFTITAGATAFAVNDEFDFSTIAYQIAYNRLYKQVAGAWVLYQDNLSGTSFTDYLICSGVATTYGVSAMGTNGVESVISPVTITVTYIGDWLYDTSIGKQFQFLYNRAAYEMGVLEERKEFNTFGTKPMIRRGPQNAKKGTLAALMMFGAQSPIQQIQALEASIANHPIYYLKTAVGEIFKVDVYNGRRSMPVEYLNSQAIQYSVDWTEVN